ncbi:glycosyltransferase family 4 protein [Streptomyces sp. NPDC087272]|uniref:glycosyltransferase family 4 protein n=1 Tax=Streptomyces sp. NPDC087272 TaxID=3365775 RepID=UPI0037F12235
MRRGRRRVLVIIPVYGQHALPTGAFVTTREYVRHLAATGYAVDVVTTIKEPGEVRRDGGVRVWPLRQWRRAVQASAPELVISHHGDRKAPRIIGRLERVPHLLMVHGLANHRDFGTPAMVWFPSEACRGHYPNYRGRSLVLPPPIDAGLYRTTSGTLVTLNGSTTAKGADVLARVAERMPDTWFLMVRAAGHTPAGPLPPNVEVADRMAPRAVYARTRVLLMPSTTESYGRAGVEAMLSGIPVVAAPLPGIQEALGQAATYIPREDTGRWVDELRRLARPAAYKEAAQRCRAHAERLDYRKNLTTFEATCRALTG